MVTVQYSLDLLDQLEGFQTFIKFALIEFLLLTTLSYNQKQFVVVNLYKLMLKSQAETLILGHQVLELVMSILQIQHLHRPPQQRTL